MKHKEKEDDGKQQVEDLKLEQIMKKKKKGKDMPLITDIELLKRFYGDDHKLDNTDKFLRNYVRIFEG